MIYIDGFPFSIDGSSSSSRADGSLITLMEHPYLVSASHSFKAMPVKKVSTSEAPALEGSSRSKFVFIFQREYATVDPALVNFVGTDEATTCAGLAIRNRESGITSIAHLDSPHVVDVGLTQMLSLVVDHNPGSVLDVHLIGAFEDVPFQNVHDSFNLRRHAKNGGYSLPLCFKIVEVLAKRKENFHIQMLHILDHNTRWDSEGNAFPIFSGFLVETTTGNVIPATFDRTSRCPDEIVRRIRLTASFEDPTWTGRLLETYNTQTDSFVIGPSTWKKRELRIALALQNLSDEEILLTCSTSPSAEGPDFVENERRKWNYLLQHHDWRKTFPLKQPRVFVRAEDGGWTRRSEQ